MSYREVYYKSILKYKLEKFIKVKKNNKKVSSEPGPTNQVHNKGHETGMML